ncbi:MAG TPA: HDOD domain-containing protein [Tepidisphaeraceae bacterium]|jgi:HD-like signal output (HDOD) protein
MFGLFAKKGRPAEARPENFGAIDGFLTQHAAIQVMPENTTRILRLVNDPECNLSTLSKLITQDAALAGAIMRAVNSAYYALQDKMTRLDRAVNYLGLRTVKELTLSAAVGPMFKPTKLGKYDGRSLWDHSVGVAILARELAVASKCCDAEEAFLAGVMHDIALPLLAQSDPAKLTSVFAKAADGGSFSDLEFEAFGFDHSQLGGRLASRWSLADALSAVIRWHHSPAEAPEKHRSLCACVFLADTLCARAAVGCPLSSIGQDLTDEDFSSLKIARESAEATAAKLPLLLRLYLSF